MLSAFWIGLGSFWTAMFSMAFMFPSVTDEPDKTAIHLTAFVLIIGLVGSFIITLIQTIMN